MCNPLSAGACRMKGIDVEHNTNYTDECSTWWVFTHAVNFFLHTCTVHVVLVQYRVGWKYQS